MRHQTEWNIFAIGFTGVMVALLSLFLVGGPFCSLGIPRKPDVVTGGMLVREPADLVVTINDRGVVYSRGGDLETALASKRYTRIVVEADRNIKYGTLEPVLRAARAHKLPVVFVGESRSVLEQVAMERVVATVR